MVQGLGFRVEGYIQPKLLKGGYVGGSYRVEGLGSNFLKGVNDGDDIRDHHMGHQGGC